MEPTCSSETSDNAYKTAWCVTTERTTVPNGHWVSIPWNQYRGVIETHHSNKGNHLRGNVRVAFAALCFQTLYIIRVCWVPCCFVTGIFMYVSGCSFVDVSVYWFVRIAYTSKALWICDQQHWFAKCNSVTVPCISLKQYLCVSVYDKYCSQPLLIRLQLIRMSDNPDLNMKNEKFSSQLSTYFKKTTFRLCWGQLERLKPRKKISNIGFSWM
jgi:hypothetical protein